VRILLTGASGFVGSNLINDWEDDDLIDRVSLRNRAVENLDLSPYSVVIHLAGIASAKNISIDELYSVNSELTVLLAVASKLAGVKQFVFLSSSKVYGEYGESKIYNEDSVCAPSCDYGKSKLQAEEELLKINSNCFTVTIIRPPLIYGPGVKGNLYSLAKLITKVPLLPFGGIDNKRSMVYVGNLILLIKHLTKNRFEGIFIAGDLTIHSTTELLRLMGESLGENSILFRMPSVFVSCFKLIAPSVVNRLFDSYIVDNSLTNSRTGFIPAFSFQIGVKEMCAYYLNTQIRK